jgi:hypothetical protein
MLAAATGGRRLRAPPWPRLLCGPRAHPTPHARGLASAVGVRPFALLLLSAVGCATPPPAAAREVAPATAKPSPDAGDACQGDFSGLWRHSEDDGFRYLAHDDGGTLLLDVRRAAEDGGVVSSEVVLVRSGESFVGAVGLARAEVDGGCVVLFPVQVVSCADGGLVVATVDRLRVDETCRAVEPTPARRLHRLVRVPGDGGR